MIKNIMKQIKIGTIVNGFKNINSDFTNVENIYNNNLLQYYINNSDKVTTVNGKGIEIVNTIILDPTNIVVSKTKQGFTLSENDFLKCEFENLNFIANEKLLFSEIKQFEVYKLYIETKINKPQQPEAVKKDEVVKKLHNNIFIGNAFEIWESMFNSFEITESSRTDIRFMFDTMQNDTLIHREISQKNILDWITLTYEFTIEKPQFKDFRNDSLRNNTYKIAKTLYYK